jgi:hypothetical protein
MGLVDVKMQALCRSSEKDRMGAHRLEAYNTFLRHTFS